MDPQRQGVLGRSICMRSSLLILIAAAVLGAADVELALTNGRTVRGELVSEADGNLVLRSRFPARGAIKQVESTYAKGDILRRKELTSVQQQYDERKARTPDTVPEQCTLAQWAYENCLREQAKTHALRVLELDSENAWAKRVLDNCGYIEVSGKWVDEAEYLKANGLVRVDGELVAAGLAEARRDYTRAKTNEENLKRKVAETRETATGKAESAAAAEGKSKESAAAAEAAGKAVDEAEKALAEARQAPQGRGDDGRKERSDRIDAATKKLTETRTKQREAKDAAEKAKRAGSSDKSASERAKAALPDLEAALAKATEDLKAAAAKLPKDDPLLAKAAEEPAPATTKEAAKNAEPGAKAEPEKPQLRRLRSGGGD